MRTRIQSGTVRRRAAMRFRADESGASAIEFAIVAPLFLALVFGIVVYGCYFASLSVVNHVASEAARATLFGLSDDERLTLAVTRANEVVASYSALLNTDTIVIDAAPSGTGLFSVTVQNQFDAFGLETFSAFLPLPPSVQTATVQVSHGGY